MAFDYKLGQLLTTTMDVSSDPNGIPKNTHLVVLRWNGNFYIDVLTPLGVTKVHHSWFDRSVVRRCHGATAFRESLDE